MSDFDFRGARDVIFDSSLSVYAKAVFIQLVEHMPNCRPGFARLCQRTSLSRAQVIREIHSLEKLGCIVVSRVSGIGNSYALAEDWVQRLPVSTSNQCPPDTGIHQTLDPSLPDTGGVSTSNGTGIHQTPKAGKKQEDKQEGSRERRARSKQPRVFYLPEDWEPKAKHLEYAKEHHIDIAAKAIKFKADMQGGRKPSKNSVSVNFDGVFWTYLQNEAKWANERSTRSVARSGPTQPGINQNLAFGDDFDEQPRVAGVRA